VTAPKDLADRLSRCWLLARPNCACEEHKALDHSIQLEPIPLSGARLGIELLLGCKSFEAILIALLSAWLALQRESPLIAAGHNVDDAESL
jgi:hypothetical protein